MDDMGPLGPILAQGRTATVHALGADRVVKLLRPGFPDSLIETEAVALAAGKAAGVPVPRLHAIGRFDSRLGLVTDRVRGPTMADALVRRPWRTAQLARLLAGLQASMHERAAPALSERADALEHSIEAVRDRLPGGAGERALRHARQLTGEPRLLHGDLHPGNVIMAGDGPVIIDWLDAARGAPAADVARTMYLLVDSQLGDETPRAAGVLITLLRRRFAAAYLAEYARRRPLRADELHAWRVPILAARLAEGIAAEDRRILGELAHMTADGPP